MRPGPSASSGPTATTPPTTPSTLRWLCPCAYCRGEAGLPGWLDTNPTLTPDQTRLVDVALVGAYAIQVTWGDGHATGYHTFRLLREQCPCAVVHPGQGTAAQDRMEEHR